VTRSDETEAKLRDLFVRASAAAAETDPFRAIAAEMFRAYRDDLQRFVAKSFPKSPVDDVCSATWEVLPRTLKDFKGDSSFHTWLLRIARHKAMDEVRRVKGKRPTALHDIISKLAPPAPSRERPSREVARAEMNELVRGIINQLEPDDQELLLLHYGEGQSAADIARARGVPPNTVAQRLVRTRNRVRKLCEAAGVGE
jgi:RNA polymerase sigma-70 factor (ECF subfamily)